MSKTPQLRASYDSDDELESYLLKNDHNDSDQEEEDELKTLSFEHLKKAQDEYDEDEKTNKKKGKGKKSGKVDKQKIQETKLALKEQLKKVSKSNRVAEDEGESDVSDGMFEEEDSEDADSEDDDHRTRRGNSKKKHKHAPSEQSSKRRVPKIRKIPGLESSRESSSSLYTDIRFDTAFGKADANRIRKDYKFLDEYRQNEIDEIGKMLKDNKMKNKLSHSQITDLEYQAKSLKSRLDTLKNRDLQQDVIKQYKQEHNTKGKQFFLKKSDQRKIVQKHKFDNMKSRQREKVVERKRKRRLGKEFKQLEFNQRS